MGDMEKYLRPHHGMCFQFYEGKGYTVETVVGTIFAGRRKAAMKKVRITVKKIASYEDLMAEYENPIEHACSMKLGQTFVCNGWQRPEGFCESAWETVSPFVMTLAHGGENFYDGWMKNPKSAMISCNDGFRPVSFLIETLDEDSE